MPSKRRAYHHGNLRATLIESGLKLIEEKGVQALTLREIGARVGVSRSAAYRHFTDKAHLLDEIREAGFTLFADALAAARDSAHPDFASRLAAMGAAYVRFAAEHRAHFDVMFHSLDAGVGTGVDMEARRQSAAGVRAFAILENTIREGQQSGDVRPGDPAALARLVWSLVHGISILRLEPDLDTLGADPRFTLFCTEILRAGLAPV